MRRRDFVALLSALASAWPLVGRGQQKAMPVIGWLSVGSPSTDEPFRLPAFRRGLSEKGYDEGRNVAIKYCWAEGEYNRLPNLAADLVRRQVSVIVTSGAPPAFASKAETSTIPIVFNQGVDPVQSGLVTSFNRPGGNITGVAVLTAELAGKRLDMLHELHPAASIFALLVHPTNPVTASEIRNFEDAAHSLGLQTHIARASTPSEIDGAFRSLVERGAAGLVVSGDPFFTISYDVLLYDLTSTYFEADPPFPEGDKRRFGYSRRERSAFTAAVSRTAPMRPPRIGRCWRVSNSQNQLSAGWAMARSRDRSRTVRRSLRGSRLGRGSATVPVTPFLISTPASSTFRAGPSSRAAKSRSPP
jgi:putative tryptophan/tyrosine transport system substrate-binding protein